MGILHHLFKLLKGLWLMENPSLNLVGATPVGDSVEVFGQRSIAEDLGLLVLGVIGKGEGVVGGGTTKKKKCCVAKVLAELGVGGGW